MPGRGDAGAGEPRGAGEAGRGGEGASSAVPRLHVLVDDATAARPDFRAAARRLFGVCGVELALHLRLREAADRRLFPLAVALAAEARAAGGWCVVNGRPDIALAAGASAVQLGATALPVGAVADLVAGRLRIGASVHGEEEARAAVRAGANHLVLGTIHPTPSHPGRPGAGPALVRRVRRALRPVGGVPLVAIGGLDRPRVAGVVRAGAHGVAVRRAVWSAADPAGAARGLLEALRAALEEGEAPSGASPGDARNGGAG